MIDMTFARLANEKSARERAAERRRKKLLWLRILVCIPLTIFSTEVVWMLFKHPVQALEGVALVCALAVIGKTIDDIIKEYGHRNDE